MNEQKQIPAVTVIVPVYNGERFLPRCLDAINASEHTPLEIIVVDDCSTDDSAEISRRRGAKVIATVRQSGPGAARNLAAGEARGEILLFVDADVVIKPDTISKISRCFVERPELSALFGSYDDEPGEQNFLSQYRNLLHHFVHQTSSPEASTFWAGLGAIRRDVFVAVGGFDCEKFAVPSIEDIELGARLRSAGHRILLAKEIQAQHLKRWTLIPMVKTDIFCRALPWSKLILTSKGLINDLNLKTGDRLSAVLVGLSCMLLPLTIWKPVLGLLLAVLLLSILFLNREIFRFFYRSRGLLFAIRAFPCQLMYFFYSGVAFVYSWFRYALPAMLGIGNAGEVSAAERPH
jgi:glycosyltransferase involved in cell wall biosynthesis